MNKRRMIKETLDRQLKDKNVRVRSEIEEKKHFDAILLKNAQQQEEEEQKKQVVLKQKIMQQK